MGNTTWLWRREGRKGGVGVSDPTWRWDKDDAGIDIQRWTGSDKGHESGVMTRRIFWQGDDVGDGIWLVRGCRYVQVRGLGLIFGVGRLAASTKRLPVSDGLQPGQKKIEPSNQGTSPQVTWSSFYSSSYSSSSFSSYSSLSSSSSSPSSSPSSSLAGWLSSKRIGHVRGN